jgi:hypothetical protein
VVPGLERVTEWKAHQADLVQWLAPVGPAEHFLAQRVAEMSWRLRRVIHYERAMLMEQVQAATPDEAAREVLPDPDEAQHIMRYEQHLGRGLYQALHELEALQARRRGDAAPLARLDVHGVDEGMQGDGPR